MHAVAAPREPVAVEGVLLHRLWAGLPVLGHRPPARAPSVAATRGTLVHAALERLFCLERARAHPRAGAGVPRGGHRRLPRPPRVQRARARRRGGGHLHRGGRVAAREVLPPRGPHRHHPDRHRAEARGRAGRRAPPRASSTGSSSTPTASSWSPTTRRAGARGAAGAAAPGRRGASTRCCASGCSGAARPRCSSSTSPIRWPSSPCPPIGPPVGCERKLAAVWTAVERACEREDFRPNPGRLCDWCAFKAYCPSFGGDIALADAYRIDQEQQRLAVAEPITRLAAGYRARCPSARRAKQAIVDFDDAVDRRVDRIRGHRTIDRVMYGASELGDWSPDLAPHRRRPGAAPRPRPDGCRARCRPSSAPSRCW